VDQVNQEHRYGKRAVGFLIGYGLIPFWAGATAEGILAAFEGHLLRSPLNPEPGRDVQATLTGSLRMNAGNLGTAQFPAVPTARRNIFGWFAQITELQ
jgi:hypothetical protein